MASERDQFKSSFASFVARERELERNRARRDTSEATRPNVAPDARTPAAGEAVPGATTAAPRRS